MFVWQVFKFQPINTQMYFSVGSLTSVPRREIHILLIIVLKNSGILLLTVQRLSDFAYESHAQVKDTRLPKLNVLFVLR